MVDLIFSTATVLAEVIRLKQISASEVLDTHLAHITEHNSKLHAVVTLDEDGAHTLAHKADNALANGEV